MEPSVRQVNVKTISGEVKSLTVSQQITVGDFKTKVLESFNVPIDRQRLICQGKLLKDEHLLSEYVKDDGQTVHLMVKADGPPSGPQQSSNPPPQAAPSGMPFQLDQVISSVLSGILPGAQLISSNQFLGGLGSRPAQAGPPPQIPNPINPPNSGNQGHPHVHPHSHVHPNPNPQNRPSNPSNQPPPGQQPGPRQVEITLPFDRVLNIGNIVNELHGPGASFPPPRMPQLPVPRNPLVLLGGYLHNYQFQLMRLLPFISRLADLMQRESLIQDPNERQLLQILGQRVGLAMQELTLSTGPVMQILQQIQIGPQPGQFQMRIGNYPVSPEVRQDSQAGNLSPPPPNVPPPSNLPQQSPPVNPLPGNPPPVSDPNISNPALRNPNPNPLIPSGLAMPNPLAGGPAGLMNLLGGLMGPGQGMPMLPGMNLQMGPGLVMPGGPGGPAGSPAGLVSMVPMLTQMLGGNQGMTLRELINTLQMHDEEESLPMMDFFYNLNISEIMILATGNWDPIERQRPAVRESLLKLMEEDSPEGRLRIVHILINYMQRQYAVPDEFIPMLAQGFSPQNAINAIGERWLAALVNLVMDYEGQSFVSEFRNTLELMIGNYAEDMGSHIQGGVPTVLNMIQVQMQTAMNRIMPPEFTGMIGGIMGTILSGYVSRALEVYKQWVLANRTQEEAKESPQTPAAALLATWQDTIERDLALNVPQQRPFSRSYLDSDVFASPESVPNLQQFFLRSLGTAFNATGVSPTPNSAPAEVIHEFFSSFANYTRERLQNDQDFRVGRHEFLDRIRK